MDFDDYLNGQVGPGTKFRCPLHDDSTGSSLFYPNGQWHCFGCGKHAFSLADLVRQVIYPEELRGIGTEMAKYWLANHDGHPLTRPPVNAAPKPVAPLTYAVMTRFCAEATDLLSSNPGLNRMIGRERGLANPAALGLGMADEGLVDRVRAAFAGDIEEALADAGVLRKDGTYRLGRRLTIPAVVDGEVRFYQARATTPQQAVKYLNPALPKVLFGEATLDRPGPVWVGEGPFDVLPLIEAGAAAVTGMGAHLAGHLLEALAKRCQGRDVWLAFDGDDPGRAAAKELSAQLEGLGVWALPLHPPTPYKDYGEWAAKEGATAILARELEW